MKNVILLVLAIFATVIGAVSLCHAESGKEADVDSANSAPRVYIDCDVCDGDYIKTEITFVNYVRDRKAAEVLVLVTTQTTAGGGKEYDIAFIGQEKYVGMEDTLKFISKFGDTEDDVRKGMAQVLKTGLVRYVARTPLAKQISISFEQPAQTTVATDRWHNWVFSIGLSSWFEGEKYRDYVSIYGSLSAKRITPELKIKLSAYEDYDEDRYEIGNETARSISRSRSLYGLGVKSLGEHWSAGASADARTSTYNNIALSVSGGPAVEYDIFPYSASSRREFRFLYELGLRSVRYMEETIYDKTSEYLTDQSLSATLETKQTWGSIETTLSGSHYLHDVRRNRVDLDGEISLPVFEGISFRLYGWGAMIHNQLSLPKAGATRDEILLKRAELETQYEYYGSLGLSYTFGSIYSNVVNPRFGN
jgi:hypothetical protein